MNDLFTLAVLFNLLTFTVLLIIILHTRAQRLRGDQFLSNSLLDLRKMISDLRTENLKLKRRVWNLEDHTPEDALAEALRASKDFQAKASELVKKHPQWDGIVELPEPQSPSENWSPPRCECGGQVSLAGECSTCRKVKQ